MHRFSRALAAAMALTAAFGISGAAAQPIDPQPHIQVPAGTPVGEVADPGRARYYPGIGFRYALPPGQRVYGYTSGPRVYGYAARRDRWRRRCAGLFWWDCWRW
jgi:hypothetical protein